jgi:hypothetical protein
MSENIAWYPPIIVGTTGSVKIIKANDAFITKIVD